MDVTVFRGSSACLRVILHPLLSQVVVFQADRMIGLERMEKVQKRLAIN
jgi:hypothetical protein